MAMRIRVRELVDPRYLDWRKAMVEDIRRTKHYNSKANGVRVVTKKQPAEHKHA